MFSADIARTKLRRVSITIRGMTVQYLRFTSFAMGWRPHHSLIFFPRLLLHNLLDEFFQRTLLEPTVSAGLLYIRKNGSNKGCITANGLFHRHSESPKHESYEARKRSGISTQTAGHHNNDDD